ncbi:HdeD family acid-resistance protein [Vagococcus sp.]|uniref:HdeD family acid-resistance protein n=1 Tax=Vagococcus sp. TaxID=1933889 RepID=UPI003F9C866B
MISSLFSSLKRYAVIRSLAFILLGIATLIDPYGVFKILVYIIAGYNLVLGIINLIDGLRNKQMTGFNFKIPIAIFYLLFSVFIFKFADPLFSMITIFLGILIMISGLSKITQAFNLKKFVNVPWISVLLYGILLFIAGLVILRNPFATKLVFYQFIGILLLFTGISELITYFRLKKYDIS